MIPENLEDIDEALDILKRLYGSPSRLTKARKSKLLSMGPYPKRDLKSVANVKSRVEWLMEAKLLLKDLFDLANQDDDCYCEVYCSSTLLSLKSLFPAKIHTDLNKFRGSVKERMEEMYDYLDQLFDETNEILRDLDEDNEDNAVMNVSQVRNLFRDNFSNFLLARLYYSNCRLSQFPGTI